MISLVLVILAGFSKAIMDTLQFHYSISVFASRNSIFWNPSVSWKNKWKNGNKSEGEKFFLSSTLFVSLTDGWHLNQMFFLTYIVMAMVFYKPIVNPLVDFLILKAAMTGTFELFFGKLLISK